MNVYLNLTGRLEISVAIAMIVGEIRLLLEECNQKMETLEQLIKKEEMS